MNETDRWNAIKRPLPMRERWVSLFSASAESTGWFERLSIAYTGPQRFYHNLDHIKQVLDWLPVVGKQFTPTESRAYHLAAWFHDVVYDSRASDNEEQSAALLEQAAGELDCSLIETSLARSWILATKKHDPTDAAAAAFCDADLAIPGSPPEVYRNYRNAIRQEYVWVSDTDYRIGRSNVLRRFLDRPRTYHSADLDWLETCARRNIADEISQLARD